MATGYTAIIHDGATFEQFVWTCARGFGAFVHMRDSGLSAQPEPPKPNTWHEQHVCELEKERAAIAALTNAQATEKSKAEHRKLVEFTKRYNQEKRKSKARYEKMRAKVEAWEPPTPEHKGLKTFMLEQIDESIAFDCSGNQEGPLDPPLPGDEWKHQELERLDISIAIYKRLAEEDRQRYESKIAWIKALQKSVPVPTDIRPKEAT